MPIARRVVTGVAIGVVSTLIVQAIIARSPAVKGIVLGASPPAEL